MPLVRIKALVERADEGEGTAKHFLYILLCQNEQVHQAVTLRTVYTPRHIRIDNDEPGLEYLDPDQVVVASVYAWGKLMDYQAFGGPLSALLQIGTQQAALVAIPDLKESACQLVGVEANGIEYLLPTFRAENDSQCGPALKGAGLFGGRLNKINLLLQAEYLATYLQGAKRFRDQLFELLGRFEGLPKVSVDII